MSRIKNQSGFTLVEVIMVIIIMGIIASVAMKSLDSGLRATRVEQTKTELRALSQAIAGNPELYSNGVRTDYGYVGDVGSLPSNLDALVTNPGYATWNGPYVKSDFLSYSDDYKQDAWGQSYIYGGGITITSTGGGNDTLQFVLTSAAVNYTSNSVSGTITDAVGNPPGDSAVNLRVVLRYPNGSGGMKDSILTPNASGYFNFDSNVPIGNHTLTAIYASTDDTVISFVSVPPKSDVRTSLRFPGALWSAAGGSGGETGGEALEYVSGSADKYGQANSSISFRINNASGDSKTISWIRVSYSDYAFFSLVVWNGTSVFNSTNPRGGSGDQIAFSIPQNVPGSASDILIQVEDFRDELYGSGGSRVNMSNENITVEFSDGSSITFNTND